MNNSDMPAMPTSAIEAKMTHEQFMNETGGGRFLPSYGLSKREHFAGLAMQGWLASELSLQMQDADIATASVEVADALLAELDKVK